jgi:2-iminobutanoate/2-iminopropanoate deaminase
LSELIIAPDAPSAAGPYSPGLAVGDWIFLSGQGGFDPDTGELVSDTIADQTTQAFRNVEVLVHLRDLAQFEEFNASYEQQFPGLVKPVRTTVGCDLAAGMRVEVTVVACRPGRAASAVTPAGR